MNTAATSFSSGDDPFPDVDVVDDAGGADDDDALFHHPHLFDNFYTPLLAFDYDYDHEPVTKP